MSAKGNDPEGGSSRQFLCKPDVVLPQGLRRVSYNNWIKNMKNHTNDRLQILANGFCPLPNKDKLCQFTGWPTVEVTEEEIMRWDRMHNTEATGLRLQDGLMALDFDVDHPDALDLYSHLEREFPKLTTALARKGKGHKEAWFLRVSQAFPRIAGPILQSPGADAEAEGHRVESWGGSSNRQFGAMGWHTKDVLKYSWHDDMSPLTERLADLPEITEADVFEIVDESTRWLMARGWTVFSREGEGRTDPHTVFDLTEDMVFATREDGEVILDALAHMAGTGYYYCSASFVDGPVARNTRRCSVTVGDDEGVVIWDSMTDITHRESRFAPLTREDEAGVMELLVQQAEAAGIVPDIPERIERAFAWHDYMFTEEGAIRQNESNLATRLRDDDWAGVFSRSEFDWQIWVMEPMPEDARGLPHPRTLMDDDFLHVMEVMQHDVFPSASMAKVRTAVGMVAVANPHHGPRDYLSGLAWDGDCRLSTLAETYLGTVVNGDAAYVRTVLRKWMISAVARIMQPGCKADHMLILQGEQNVGKSTFFEALAGQWFGDDMPPVGHKDAKQWIRTKWIAEIAELSAIRGKDVEHVKSFLTTRVDSYRKAYGAVDETIPRQTIFGGSTNADAYLNDPTGGRRYWPIRVVTIDIAGVRRDRDQLWAEAVAAYAAGEHWHLDAEIDVDAIIGAEIAQEDAYEVDPDEERILAFLRVQVEWVKVREIYEQVFLQPGDRARKTDGRTSHVITEALRRGGWKHGTVVRGTRRWVRGPKAAPLLVLDRSGATTAEKAAARDMDIHDNDA